MIGERVRIVREAVGMSQTELADRIPLSQKQVSRIERGLFVQPPRRTLVRLAEVLDVPLVTGEVNDWLTQCGYLPLVRPGLPLPPELADWLEGLSATPVIVIDPSGTLRYANDLFDLLDGGIRQPLDTLLAWALDARSPLDPRDRLRLLAWYRGLLRFVVAETWVDQVRDSLRAQYPDTDRLWPRDGRLTLAPGDLSALPVHVSTGGSPPLAFRVGVSQPFWRPDLQIMVFRPHDRRTDMWRREARLSASRDAADVTHRSS